MLQQIVLRDPAIAQWLTFSDPVDVFVADRAADVLPVLRAVERRVQKEGLYAAGFVTYEAAAGFDQSLVTHEPGRCPLICFGLFAEGRISDEPELQKSGSRKIAQWHMQEGSDRYRKKIEHIKALIEAGLTYQINYTVRQTAAEIENAQSLFWQIAADAPYAAFIDCDEFSVVSASPELFFRREKDLLTCKPMKGTSRRGLTAEQDIERRDTLYRSAKNRAENVMILDMVRNDMGRIADSGSVTVAEQYAIEKYPTVWQMTSTVTAATSASMAEIFTALFPSASVTGAPKVSSMRIIEELEESPRGIYTGAIGYFGPDNRAQFNVAIRTALVDKTEDSATYGVGGGIVWDSDPVDEYDECLAKSAVLTATEVASEFALLETLLWTPNTGYVLLGDHLDRLVQSADYFQFRVDRPAIENALQNLAGTFSVQRRKIRLVSQRGGDFSVTHSVVSATDFRAPRSIVFAAEPIEVDDVFLYHKTTHRTVYDKALAGASAADDVLLWNSDGYITETSIANVAVRFDGELCTPPTSDGLLNGTYRNWLLQNGMIHERSIHFDELNDGHELLLFNSVRGQYLAKLSLQAQEQSARDI
jgi:para-aminobenzoate synthetase/4-amino-4-deoxychorismate lyase